MLTDFGGGFGGVENDFGQWDHLRCVVVDDLRIIYRLFGVAVAHQDDLWRDIFFDFGQCLGIMILQSLNKSLFRLVGIIDFFCSEERVRRFVVRGVTVANGVECEQCQQSDDANG